MSAKILLITAVDETHRQLLLESQGYLVQTAAHEDVPKHLSEDDYQLALVSTENGVAATLAFCETVKSNFPDVRIVVVAQRAEYIPANDFVDAVIREQHSPGRFLAAVKRLIDAGNSQQQSFSAADGQ